MEQRSAGAVILTAVRLERGLSQQTAAENNGLQGSVWSKLETGNMKPYSRELTIKLDEWTKGACAWHLWDEPPTGAQLDRLKRAREKRSGRQAA